MADVRSLFVPVILGTPRRGRMSEHAARLMHTEVGKRPGVETAFESSESPPGSSAAPG
jgi:hypothetical protein